MKPTVIIAGADIAIEANTVQKEMITEQSAAKSERTMAAAAIKSGVHNGAPRIKSRVFIILIFLP